MVNDALPEDLRDHERVLDKKGVNALMREIAQKHPEKYREVSHALSQIGQHAAYTTGGNSFGLHHMKMAPSARLAREKLRGQIQEAMDNDELSDEQRETLFVRLAGRLARKQQDEIFDESLKEGNPLAYQVLSGAKGSKMNLASLRGSDLLYTDHRGKVLPIPVLRSYSQGLRPVEYWAGSYGARKGVVDLKFCVFSEEKVLMADYSEKPIGEVRSGEWVMGANRRGEMFPVRVVERYDNGERPCYRYRFRKGSCRNDSAFRELVATEDHKILAQVKAGRPGSTYAHRSIYEPTLLSLGSARLQKNPTKNEFVAYPSRGETGCLDRVDEPRALLAGLMIGDGCMAPSCHGSYSLSCADPVLLEDVREYLAQFNLKLSRQSSGSYNYSLSEIVSSPRRTQVVAGHNSFVPGHCNETKAWLRYHLGEKLAHEKPVPEEVWSWNDCSVGDFLGGILSADVCVENRKNGCTIKLRLTSCDVVTQVQRLLELRLGIWTGALRQIPKEQFKHATHDQYEITVNHPECVRRFAERVRLVGCKRQELADAMQYQSKDPASREVGFKIYSKEFVGSRSTCDLEVDHPSHMFVLANGVIVANSTQRAGFLSKQLNQIAHRALVTALDAKKEPETLRGLPVETDDPDNEGTLLAYPVAGYKRNTVLTPKILADLQRRKIQRLLVRSPAVFGTPDGGVYARDVGIREFGRLPAAGENVGLTAAQALSEPLTQAQISSKHTGGVAGAGAEAAISGFDRINQLIQTPKAFKGGAAHARKDGLVQFVEDAPAGGMFVTIDDEKHYVGDGFDLKVKRGDHIEAGDVISEGIPNPSIIVQHKGIGEGRRYFVKVFREAFEDAGIARKTGTRRNIELLARGLINHVRLTDEVGDFAPDDIVPYSMLEHRYRPRPDALAMIPKRAVGHYLEKPYLHYSVGTRVRPSMLRDFQDFGISEVVAHPDAPPFEPEMVRGMATLQHDPDWMTRMFGSGLKTSLLKGVHRGGHSTTTGTSFVPALANPITFGQTGKVVTPQTEDDQDRSQKQFKMAADEEQYIRAINLALRQQRHRDLALRKAYYAHQDAVAKDEAGWDWGDIGDIVRAEPLFSLGEGGLRRPGLTDSQGTSYPSFETEKYLDLSGMPGVPEGEDPASYHLPPVGETPGWTIAENLRDDLGYEHNPQREIAAYNRNLGQGPHGGRAAALSLMQEHYPELYAKAQEDVFDPATEWASLRPQDREVVLRELYSGATAGGQILQPTMDYAELASQEQMPHQYAQFFGDTYSSETRDPVTNKLVNRDVATGESSPATMLAAFESAPETTAAWQALPPDARRAMQMEQGMLRFSAERGHSTPQETAAGYARLIGVARAAAQGDPQLAKKYIQSWKSPETETGTAAFASFVPHTQAAIDPTNPHAQGQLEHAFLNDPQIAAKLQVVSPDAHRAYGEQLRAIMSENVPFEEKQQMAGRLATAFLTAEGGVDREQIEGWRAPETASPPLQVQPTYPETVSPQWQPQQPYQAPELAQTIQPPPRPAGQEAIALQQTRTVTPAEMTDEMIEAFAAGLPPEIQQQEIARMQQERATAIAQGQQPAEPLAQAAPPQAAPPAPVPAAPPTQQPPAVAQQPQPESPAISPQFTPQRAGVPYRSTQGMLPFATAMHKAMPGSVEQTFQALGPAAPLAWGALFDPGAVQTITGIGAPTTGATAPTMPKPGDVPKLPGPKKPLKPLKPVGSLG